MKLTQTTLLAFALVVPAAAQATLFEEDFSAGFTNWTPSSYWTAVTSANTCVQQSGAAPGSGMMARMGNPANCTFWEIDAWLNYPLTLNDSISIPLYADSPTLSFESFTDSELCNGWDDHDVYILGDEGYWELLARDCEFYREWHTVHLDLSPWKGQEIQVRFSFIAWDWLANDGAGWLVDDVRVTTGDCISQNFCIAAPNSVSVAGAIMGDVGSKRVHVNDYALTVSGAPPGQFAHFFYGPFEEQTPLASGFLCVGTDSGGFRRLHPGGQIDMNGNYEQPVDLSMPAGVHAAILPGTQFKFQCWYRDFDSGVSTSNFSDGLSVTFCE